MLNGRPVTFSAWNPQDEPLMTRCWANVAPARRCTNQVSDAAEVSGLCPRCTRRLRAK